MIVKFRTMGSVHGGGGGPLPDEARLTRFGQFLRATSFDELPELINVLRGEMSLVGPRPLLMEYLPRYTTFQARRHEVRPGITGLAQINGRNALGWEQRFQFDVWYVDHRSFWLDLKIILITILKVLTRQGVSAPGHATMPEFLGSEPGTATALLRVKSPRSASWRWARALAGGIVAAELAAASFVALIDPYGITGSPTVRGINAEKTQRSDGGGRVEKSMRLWLSDYGTVILGGTAAWSGLDPAGPTLAGFDAYNASVPNATMNEVAATGRFVLEHGKAERVIIGLQFSMSESDQTTRHDFSESGLGGWPMPVVVAKSLFSPAAFVDALQTVRDNVTGLREADLANGYHRVRVDFDYNYRQAFTDVLLQNYLVQPWKYGQFEYDVGRIRLFEDLVRSLACRDVEVLVFVSPVHARQLEAISAMGLYPIYERWLRDLAGAVDAANASPGVQRLARLWDFSGYNSITTEDVPDHGDATAQMDWYWDSARYTPAAGELVLARMIGDTNSVPKDFGEMLDTKAMPELLSQQLRLRRQYSNMQPEEVEDVRQLVRTTAALRRRLIQQY